METKFLITVSEEELSTILTALYEERDRVAETCDPFAGEFINRAINVVMKYEKVNKN